MTTSRLVGKREGAPGRRSPGRRGRDEGGFSLPELMIALALLSLLMATILPVIGSFVSASVEVSRTYTNEDQLLPVSTSFQSLIRSAVAPAPTLANGEPVPPFGTYKKTSDTATNLTGLFSASKLTLFTNVGDPNGPAKVVASLTGTPTHYVFTITVAHAIEDTCPGVNPTLPATAQCSWGIPKVLVTVDYVVDPIIFTYNVWTKTSGTAVQKDAADFATCDNTACTADVIQSIGVDLEVNGAPKRGGEAQDQTVVYELSSTSQAYSAAVG